MSGQAANKGDIISLYFDGRKDQPLAQKKLVQHIHNSRGVLQI